MRGYRICLLCDGLSIGGAETHVVTLANTLAAMGHEVTVVSSGGALCESLSGVKHVTMPFEKRWAFLACFFGLWRLFARARFDVIHAHTRYTAFLCRPLAHGRAVCTAHWVFDTAFPKRTLSYWGCQTLAVSEDIGAYLTREYGIPKERITVTVNGIDTARFRPEKRTEGKTRVVYCSRMDRDRADAAFHLLAAAERLCERFDFSLAFIGDGDMFSALKEALAAAKAREERLDATLLGAQSDVARHLADADIFVGVSRAALEGMAAGCATVLAGNEGMLELFVPEDARTAEESNFCCRGAAPCSTEGLLDTLSSLLSLPREQLWQMGERNRQYVEERYGARRMASDALSVYEKACRARAVLCGYYGFGNVGDALLATSLTERLTARGYGEVLLLSKRKLSPRAFYAIWCRYDFFLGGGNLLQDATSRRSLFFYSSLVRFAARRGCRTALVSGGIGPLSPRAEMTARAVLSRMSGVFCRSSADAALALRLGAREAIGGADAALLLPFPRRKEESKTLLLSFRAPHEKERAATLAFALRLCRDHGRAETVFFAMHPADAPFGRRLAALCGIRFETGDAERFLSLLSESRAVIGNRLHLGVCALGVGVPFFLLADEEKCMRFLADATSCAPKGADFCASFRLTDRITRLPSGRGLSHAREAMRARAVFP